MPKWANEIMKNLFFSLFLTFGFLLFALPAFADTTTVCQPIYGGGESCVQSGNLVINKEVQNPKTNDFVNNLGVNDPKFSANMLVNFRITVSNTGGSTINNVNIQDIFPQFINFVSGAGSFDNGAKTFNFSIPSLNAGEQRTFIVTGQVVPNEQLPADKGVVCVVNQASATADNNQNSQDNAEFCLQREIVTTKGGLKVFPAPLVTTTPPTGPELLPLLALLPGGAFGFFLRKKATK